MNADALFAHLATGAGHVCQAWAITRRDGVTLGFTDHDRPLRFEGITFMADSGLSARALATVAGLAADNSEAVGLLQADVVTEADIVAGRYDGAAVRNWLVRWDDVAQRQLRFRGRIGEIVRQAGTFRVDLRGLTDLLNQPSGRTYLRSCDAVLGDARCGVRTDDPLVMTTAPVLAQDAGQSIEVAAGQHPDRWFEQGVMTVLTGQGAGLVVAIKHDLLQGGRRRLTLWDALPSPLAIGDTLRLVAGCDRRAETCRVKFANLANFRGFPTMPGEDWLMSVPRSTGTNDGGSLSS
ncbi:phage conserved hypothetical protein BR0599 [Loktanella fryxellensis]|uniref:Bacteriophage phiJL001 Gp84 C-terminal domain-containing protein n=1 Tax=Loktanella fryxellensis TaxID=245187 RepID=A0A1H7YC79_9RHOB|nr:DUF2163 domain-containing protein [Loktanella fryxellensis]SEM43826.1 phage conserved hypothetical protein BR0599 [Loktanella fryxellensis]